MSFESRLRDDLHGAPLPPSLVPRPDLADTALRRAGRPTRRRTAAVLGGALAVGLVAVGVVAAAAGRPTPAGSPGPSAPATEPSCATPVTTAAPTTAAPTTDPTTAAPTDAAPHGLGGNGPRVVEVYRTQRTADGGHSYLLDRTDWTYHELPWPTVVVSPNGMKVAVLALDGRVGLGDRSAVLRAGQSAVTWLAMPGTSSVAWSPDGKALVTLSLTKDPTFAFTAHRYEVATGAVTDTLIPDSELLVGSQVGWAADSQRYLALYRVPGDSFEIGSPRYVNPDGTLGPTIAVPGGVVGGADAYSPDGRYLILDASLLMSDEPSCSRIVEVATGTTAAVLPRGMTPVGWYLQPAFLAMVDGHLQAVDVTTLTVIKQVEVGNLWPTQFGAAGPFPGSPTDFGF